MYNITPPETGEPAKFNRKDINQQYTDEKGWQRYTYERGSHDKIRHDAIAPDGCKYPQANAEYNSQQSGDARKFQRSGCALGNNSADFASLAVADAKVALCNVAEKFDVLNGEGVIQTQLIPNAFNVSLRSFLSQKVFYGIAHKAKHGKGDKPHHQQNKDGLENASDYISQHKTLSAFV